MSVIVKGMRMPEKCGSCDLFHAEYPMHCTVVKGHKTVGAPYGMPRPEWCPLVKLPKKHGQLIDADEFLERFLSVDRTVSFGMSGLYVDIHDLYNILSSLPTVIEAGGRNMKPEIIKLIEEHPDLPVVPMVDGEVVGDYSSQYWLGHWGRAEVTEYYCGREEVHFKDDDEEDVLKDMEGCKYYCDPQGRDITELSDEEWDELYKSIPWIKCIVVYITV